MCGMTLDEEVLKAMSEAIAAEYSEYKFYKIRGVLMNIKANDMHKDKHQHTVWRTPARDMKALLDMERRLGWQ